MTRELLPLTVDHVEAVVTFRQRSFGGAPDDAVRQRTADAIARGEYWGLFEGAAPLAVARVERVDHWFGGRTVACQEVAGVAVPPEHRGGGVASTLMRGLIRVGHEDGLGLSLLFPATTALYRHLGWEQAGGRFGYRIAARTAVMGGRRLRPATPADWPAIRDCHARFGALHAAAGVRPPTRWGWLERLPMAYVLDGEEGIDAYLLYSNAFATPEDWQYTLDVDDWAATTLEGHEALLGFLARHGTIGKDMTLVGPVPHPWTFLLPEQDLRLSFNIAWMARGLDLPVAVAARGFPPGARATVTFAVDDRDLPAAGGPWLLEVADGEGKLSPADHAAVTLRPQAFGPLYTGWASAEQLALAGLLSGPAADLAALSAVFAGPVPVQFDFF